ncbi:MAG: neutral/alkaline non-lysosomal ceramidase N-terminal domain-containing protein [Planctomycetales bacterium]|nr:neutral/alkaline non-lysosomal ceramidase N-terminal domain-containing protein [Planctomycetales bacterium]
MNFEIIPQAACRAAVRRVDITPPVGIYHRMWGAASHDRSTGLHRPLTATVLALAPRDGASRSEHTLPAPRVFVSLDHCLFWTREMADVLATLSARGGIAAERITVYFTHTHAAGLMGYERAELPGGDLIAPYLQDVGQQVGDAIAAAVAALEDATILFGEARCDLARNRDYWDETRGSFVCGYNPSGTADDRVAVGKLVDAAGAPLGTIVNYACHPTTLAWDNTLISPDYPGAMREVIETDTNAPCLFVQGASGDIGPRDGFVGDVEVAERNGRQLGHAVLSVWHSLVGPGQRRAYAGAVVSGATIGTWGYEAWQDPEASKIGETVSHVALPYRRDLPERDILTKELAHWQTMERRATEAGDLQSASDARAMAERMTRRLTRVEHLPEGDSISYPIRILRLGLAIWVSLDGEHYNLLQRELRRRFPGWTIFVGTLANGSTVWYLPDSESYGKGLYQEDASVLAQGSLELLIDAAALAIQELIG